MCLSRNVRQLTHKLHKLNVLWPDNSTRIFLGRKNLFLIFFSVFYCAVGNQIMAHHGRKSVNGAAKNWERKCNSCPESPGRAAEHFSLQSQNSKTTGAFHKTGFVYNICFKCLIPSTTQRQLFWNTVQKHILSPVNIIFNIAYSGCQAIARFSLINHGVF